jgi:hypothetical protein
VFVISSTIMAKAQVAAAARFMTEVAPPPVVSVMRRRKVPWCLDTIAEDTIAEQLVACGSPSDCGFAAAWSLKRMPTPTPTPPQPRERAGGFMTRDLGKYFSDAHGCQASHRRAVHAQELHKVGA